MENMSNVIAPSSTPTIMRKPNRTQPITAPIPLVRAAQPLTQPIQQALTAPARPTILKPPMPAPMVTPSAAAPPSTTPISTPTPMQPLATQITKEPLSSAQNLSILSQIMGDNVRIQFAELQKKLESKLESMVRDVVGTAIRDLKMQFEATEMKGEVLNANTPLLARPDPEAKVEHTFELGAVIPLFQPFVPNANGTWCMTKVVTSNGSVVMGYVPIFTKKLKSVTYTPMPDSEWEKRRNEWKGSLDNLSDKDLIPHVGRCSL